MFEPKKIGSECLGSGKDCPRPSHPSYSWAMIPRARVLPTSGFHCVHLHLMLCLTHGEHSAQMLTDLIRFDGVNVNRYRRRNRSEKSKDDNYKGNSDVILTRKLSVNRLHSLFKAKSFII